MSVTEQQVPQISALAGALVSHQRFFDALSVEDRQWAFQNPKEAIAVFCDAVKNRAAKIVEKLLESVASFKAPGAKEFIAKKKYVVDTGENARVRISYLGDNFKKVMLPKKEQDIAEGELKLKKLHTGSLDAPIIVELGGEKKAEISLCEFYETLAHKQAIRDFTWVVAYIRDVDGILWAVSAGWSGGGWDVEARSVAYPYGWDAGSEFVSR